MRKNFLIFLTFVLFASLWCPHEPTCEQQHPRIYYPYLNKRQFEVKKDSVFSVNLTLSSFQMLCFYGYFRIFINDTSFLDTFIYSQEPFEYKFRYRIPDNLQENDTLKIRFSAVNKSQEDSIKIRIVVKDNYPPIISTDEQEMYFISTDFENSDMMARFDTLGVVIGNKNLDGDLTFAYHALTNGNCLLSPDNSYLAVYGEYTNQTYEYESKRRTYIIPDNSLDFDKIDAKFLDTMQIDSSKAPQIDNYGYGCNLVKEGEVFKILLSDGRKAVLKVMEISQPNPEQKISAEIGFKVKYQKFSSQESE